MLGAHAADLLDPESPLVDVDVDGRSGKSAVELRRCENADAVLRVSFARRSSMFSRLSRRTSADLAVDSGDEGLDPRLDPVPQGHRVLSQQEPDMGSSLPC